MSDIHVTCWALSKAHAEAILTGLGIIEVQDGVWQPLVDAAIAPCSVPYLTGNMITDEFGNERPADPETGFPAGMRNSAGVTYADAKDIRTPTNIWA